MLEVVLNGKEFRQQKIVVPIFSLCDDKFNIFFSSFFYLGSEDPVGF